MRFYCKSFLNTLCMMLLFDSLDSQQNWLTHYDNYQSANYHTGYKSVSYKRSAVFMHIIIIHKNSLLQEEDVKIFKFYWRARKQYQT